MFWKYSYFNTFATQYTFIYFSLKGGSERIKYNNLFHYELIK